MTRTHPVPAFAAALLAGLGAASFGGCSSDAAGGLPEYPTIQILSQRPVPGGFADIDANVSITFGADPDPATLVPSNFTVSDAAGPLPGTLDYDDATRTWTWRPTRELPRGATLRAAIDTRVIVVPNAVLAPQFTWDFRVRPGQPLPTVPVAANVISTVGDRVLAAFRRDGSAQLAAGGRSWRFTGTDVGQDEILQGGSARGIHVDAAGDIAVLVTDGVGPNATVGLTRRGNNGIWSTAELVTNSGTAALQPTARLEGNDNGDLMVQLHVSVPGTQVLDQVHWSSGVSPGSWQEVPLPFSPIWFELRAAMDGSGNITTLHAEGSFLLAQRQDPGQSAAVTYTVAQVPAVRVGGLGVSAAGEARALFYEPGNVLRQRRAQPGLSFEPPTDVPLFVPAGTQWLTAPDGAIVGWNGNNLYRSESGSDEWRSAVLPQPALAVAISPRGEAVALVFELPDVWSIVRWRGGEPADAPVQIASALSQVVAQRHGGVAVDASGRVVAAFTASSTQPLMAVLVE